MPLDILGIARYNEIVRQRKLDRIEREWLEWAKTYLIEGKIDKAVDCLAQCQIEMDRIA